MYSSYEIAEKIKALAQSRGIQIKDILIQCELNKNQMSTLYNGNFIKVDSIAKIADVLDCSIDYLMGRTNNEESHKGENEK